MYYIRQASFWKATHSEWKTFEIENWIESRSDHQSLNVIIIIIIVIIIMIIMCLVHEHLHGIGKKLHTGNLDFSLNFTWKPNRTFQHLQQSFSQVCKKLLKVMKSGFCMLTKTRKRIWSSQNEKPVPTQKPGYLPQKFFLYAYWNINNAIH